MDPGTAALAYHEATKHAFESVRRRGRLLDWDNKPAPFKAYRGLERVGLPTEVPEVSEPALRAVAGAVPPDPGRAPDAMDLSRLLWLGAGAHRRRRFPGGEEIRFRTYASAGALYPNEVYLACADLDGLPAGLYHFDPRDRMLIRLRGGDPRGHLVRAAAGEPAVAEAPVVIVLTGIPWRTAWKYGERGYRHLFWDAGMIVANLVALAAALRLPSRLVLGFADGEVEALLGLDGEREFPLCLLAVGGGAPAVAAGSPAEPVALEAEPLSRAEERFPDILAANDAGRLPDPGAVEAWRAGGARLPGGGGSEGPPVEGPPDGLGAVIRRRGSARAFGRGALPRRVLEAVLGAATRGLATDYAPAGSRLAEVFIVASAVDGLAPGAYAFGTGGLRLLREGTFRGEVGYLCLEQRLAADAAATHFLLCDLGAVLGALGDRGYRAAQLEAGVVAGRIYLGAYAHGWGATGLTFYDDEVIRFLSPEAEGRACMLVVAVGESVGRRDLRPVR